MERRVVVLTGASSGIGRAAAVAFAARGDRLVLAARGRPGLAEVAARCGERGAEAVPVAADVSRQVEVDAVAEVAVRHFGRIDVWVHTAAVMAYGRFEDVPALVFDRVVATNLLGSAAVARTALREFRRQDAGTLIICGSVLGRVTAPYLSAYASAKWGLRGLVRVLRQETRDAQGIHVCMVTPNAVDTSIYAAAANYTGRVGRPPPPVDTADRVAAVIVRCADRPRPEVAVGLTNGLMRFGFAALPGAYDAMVGPLMRVAGLSREPVAPHDGNVFIPRPRRPGGHGRWGRPAVAAGAALGTAAVLAGAAARRGRTR